MLPYACRAALLPDFAASVNLNAPQRNFAVDNFARAATMSVKMPRPEDPKLHRSSEAELVRAAIAGDKRAYAQLYDRLAPVVRAVCHDYTHSLADAQDLAQDVFLRAYQRLGELRQPESFGPWLIGIARRRCAEWRRQKAREQRKHAVRQAEKETLEAIDRPNEDGQLLRLLGELSEDERLALHAFYLQDQSAEEARRIMGLSRSGFYKLLDRARTKLRRQWEQQQENIR
jgi:RNA polymerase sigma-70 factor (ECF subfamily)